MTAACHHRAPTSQSWQLQLKTQPAVPPSGHDTTFTLHVSDAAGRPITGATAQVSLEMTFMDMGTNVVHLQDRGNGNYTGVGQFTMPGDWDCHVIVKLNQKQQTQLFHYKVG